MEQRECLSISDSILLFKIDVQSMLLVLLKIHSCSRELVYVNVWSKIEWLLAVTLFLLYSPYYRCISWDFQKQI